MVAIFPNGSNSLRKRNGFEGNTGFLAYHHRSQFSQVVFSCYHGESRSDGDPTFAFLSEMGYL